MPEYRPLPGEALRVCAALQAPPRLIAHLTLVHDTAVRLVAKFQQAFPEVELDTASILFGAATHDIGKSTYTEELIGPGKSHEAKGVDLLRKAGASEEMSRFAFTHGNWDRDAELQLEDLLVALADNCWKGKRVPELETLIVNCLVSATGKAEWEAFAILDDILVNLSEDADKRLAWQGQFPADLK